MLLFACRVFRASQTGLFPFAISITANSTLPTDLPFFPSWAMRSTTGFNALAAPPGSCGENVMLVFGVLFDVDENDFVAHWDFANAAFLTPVLHASANTPA